MPTKAICTLLVCLVVASVTNGTLAQGSKEYVLSSEYVKDAELWVWRAAFTEAAATGDAGAMCSLYAVDGSLHLPGREPAHGRRSIEAAWDALLAGGVREIRLDVRTLRHSGADVQEDGSFMFRDARGEPFASGTYTFLWARDSDRWGIKTARFDRSIVFAKRAGHGLRRGDPRSFSRRRDITDAVGLGVRGKINKP